MPLLVAEPDIYPDDLFDMTAAGADSEACWWALYTLSRREKVLMRRLRALDIPFYGPTIPKRTKSPGGRMRTAYIPLFRNYVFMFGDDYRRYDAVTTGCVSRYLKVAHRQELTHDLQQIHQLILTGVPLTPEARLQAGEQVRIRSGPFRGYEGTVIRREGQTRLLVSVKFLQQGASFVLDECELEPLDLLRRVG